MTRLPDLADLDLLVRVARTESLGAAAASLGLSQPSVSRRVAALERRLRLSLLERSPRGSTLTPQGRVVVGWAEALLRSAQEFESAVAALQRSGAGSVRAAVSMTIGEHHAPLWLAALRRSDPALEVALTVANSAGVCEQVERGVVDVGFVEGPRVPRGLRRARLGADALVIAVDPDHPWATADPLRVADLAEARLLVREPGSGTRDTLEHALARHGVTLTPALEMASNTALTAAALAGMGPVVLSELAVADELAAGRLVRVAVPELDLARAFTAVWRGDVELSPAATALLRTARDQFIEGSTGRVDAHAS